MEAKAVTWCCHCLNELVDFGERMDCELSVMNLSAERGGEAVGDGGLM